MSTLFSPLLTYIFTRVCSVLLFFGSWCRSLVETDALHPADPKMRLSLNPQEEICWRSTAASHTAGLQCRTKRLRNLKRLYARPTHTKSLYTCMKSIRNIKLSLTGVTQSVKTGITRFCTTDSRTIRKQADGNPPQRTEWRPQGSLRIPKQTFFFPGS